MNFKPRVEDNRLIRGEGRFVDDTWPPDSLVATFVRSPHAFAKIKSINVHATSSCPGVRAIFTARDIEAQGIGNVSHARHMVGRNGSKLKVPFRPALADQRVLHVGQAVVLNCSGVIGCCTGRGRLRGHRIRRVACGDLCAASNRSGKPGAMGGCPCQYCYRLARAN